MIYRRKWQKRWQQSLFCYIRDAIIFSLIHFKLPAYLRKKIFGFDPKFVFLVHPRRKDDIFMALPFLRPVRFVLPKKIRYKVIQMIPPFVLGKVKTESGVNGLIVTTTKLPDFLMQNRKKALKEIRSCIRFSHAISGDEAIMGLGGWWPMVTRRGVVVNEYAKKHRITLTNGHAGTLASLCLMVEKLCKVSGINEKDISILVLGSGKMGANFVRAMNGRVRTIYTYDKQLSKSKQLKYEFKEKNPPGSTQVIYIEYKKENLIDALNNSHLCVCTTSNIKQVLTPEEIPSNVMIIDDSRPEAFSRTLNRQKNVIIFEGGLLKIQNCKIDYNFGFGKAENVFGCLGEAYLLAADTKKTIQPTIGPIDLQNVEKMLTIFRKHNIEVGDFKSGSVYINAELIKSIMDSKAGISKEPTLC